MTLAETVRSRWVIALAAVAFAGTAIAIAPAPAPPAKPVAKAKVKPWRACGAAKTAKPPRMKPSAEVTGADYRRILMRARTVFEACTKQSPSGVTYHVKAQIGVDGRVSSVEVRGESPDLSNVSLRVVSCMEHTISGLTFPATGKATAVTTTFVAE